MIRCFFWLTSFLIIYTQFIYYLILVFLNAIIKERKISCAEDNNSEPTVTTVLAVYNGQNQIENRIKNLLEADYPKNKHEILIASDGSTDRTVQLANKFLSSQITVLGFEKNRGRASVHNDAVAVAKGDIIIFTDVDTVFSKDFVKNIVKYFSNRKIGCADSLLFYKSTGTAVSNSESFYFKFEKKIRQLESQIGILATASGPAMAVRKKLWRDLTPTDDCDFVTPLDVILQGYRLILAHDARAYDFSPASTLKAEVRIRIRMTSKNLIGTLRRWNIKACLKHPFITWGLFSHKILRWLTPFFMTGAFISNLLLLNEGAFYRSVFLLQLAFYASAIIGLTGEILKRRVPFGGIALSFCLANVGMGIGVIKGLLGKAPATYRKAD